MRRAALLSLALLLLAPVALADTSDGNGESGPDDDGYQQCLDDCRKADHPRCTAECNRETGRSSCAFSPPP